MSGVTTTTAKNLILDAGVVYVNYGELDERILGATQGGNSFTVEREIREIEIDGVKGKTKGLRRIITENASLTVNLKEMSADNIQLALAGSTVEDYPDELEKTHDNITSTGEIVDEDYVTNVAIVATVSGSGDPIVIVVKNALADGNLEFSLEDQNEATIPVTFSAHYDPADLTAPIYEIRYPVVA